MASVAPEAPGPSEPSPPSGTAHGFGRVLVAVYGLFALSATARAGVQIATQFDAAPVPYLLSAFAGVVYLGATVALARSSRTAWRTALACCSIEFLGVLTVGTVSRVMSAEFPDATVWSDYGSGYGFVPAILPVVGLYWLYRNRPKR